MADKSISELVAATAVNATDLFVLQQAGVAKKLTGQILENWLVALADGHGGIQTIEKTGTDVLVDTYTITFADETTSTFDVTNGKGIESISKTSSGLVDTYTIEYTDGDDYSFNVTNGRGITSIAKTGTSGLVDTYTITYNGGTPATSTFTVTNGKTVSDIAEKWAVSTSKTVEPETWYDTPQTLTSTNKYLWHYFIFTYNDNSTEETEPAVTGVYGDTGLNWYTWFRWSAVQPTSDSDIGTVPDKYIGTYSGTSPTAPTHYTDYTWYQYKGNTGDTGNGIESISKTSTSGLTDTYTIEFTDGTTTTFTVTNGSSIASISKTSTSGLTDTYTVTLTNGSTSTFTVHNGNSIESVELVSGTHAPGTSDTYRINFSEGTPVTFQVYNGANGTGAVSTVDGINVSGADGNVVTLLSGNAPPNQNTVGVENQRYFDYTHNILYICMGGTTGQYDWRKAGVVVDATLSESSPNPVQNAVITGALNTLSSQIESIVQESAFEVAVEGSDYVLYWYGAQGGCPYSVSLEGNEYVLYFNVA